jgi:putative ABC transport system permease protein
MYASLKTVQRIASKYAACVGDIDMNIILVEVADAQKQEEVFLSVQKILKESTISSYNCYIPARDVMNILDKASWLITLIIIIAVTLFALKSQFASIIERTHEIGILKTLGWTNRSILEQILTESIVQAIVGGTIGCLFSIFVSMLFKELTIYWLSVGLGIILILLSGVVAGMFPALKAIRLNPVEAIRQPGGK